MSTDTNHTTLLQKIITTPESVIDQLNLIYLTDDKLAISRSKSANDFCYFLDGKKITAKNEIKRIEQLAIPPAWQQVKIAPLDNGHLQATGRDVKYRKQYRYHPLWNKIRNQSKFYKMVSFGAHLPKIRACVDRDLEAKKWTQNKAVALVIRLMEETHIRIGNEQYAKRNQTYGLSTMRSKHVTLFKNALKFEFVGKKGKKHSVTLRNKKLIRLVNQCEEIPGWELFKYYDEHGEKHTLESSMVNAYLHRISGDLFTAKDFRTWAATTIFFESLRTSPYPTAVKEKQKQMLLAYDTTAKALGNTRNVCRKYYVHPGIVNAYMKGDIRTAFDQVEQMEDQLPYFSNTEAAMFSVLKTYTPDFLNTYSKN